MVQIRVMSVHRIAWIVKELTHVFAKVASPKIALIKIVMVNFLISLKVPMTRNFTLKWLNNFFYRILVTCFLCKIFNFVSYMQISPVWHCIMTFWKRNILPNLVLRKILGTRLYFTLISTIYTMSGRVISDIQTRAEGESLYIRYNTDANVVNGLKNDSSYEFIGEVILKINVV
jgi:hypothetical protein